MRLTAEEARLAAVRVRTYPAPMAHVWGVGPLMTSNEISAAMRLGSGRAKPEHG